LFELSDRKCNVNLLWYYLKIPIYPCRPGNFEHSSEGREAHYRSTRPCDCYYFSANDEPEGQSGSRLIFIVFT
jgi:hypothetical protein